MRIDVVSLFPEYFGIGMAPGVIDRARQRGLLDIQAWNPRDFTEDNYRTIDDRPFGGGPGMVMLIDPLRKALEAARAAASEPVPTIYLSPQGRPLTQQRVRELAAMPRLLLLCGRYEGIDERLVTAEVDEEISIGDYVISGGELAAAVLIDAVGRLQDGALNDADSAAQ
ncbi:MAG: tRNA (guanosine(37)-N1)-methyltransferase TrmD, partial [Xanthomonadales bacterium]|nr:tRNA (guanosine(37)-N1)-methyltransferase TrmD [Xanthomonadales bacterium]